MKESKEHITWVGTNVCSVASALHDVIALWKRAATAAMQAPTSLDAVNIYPPAIIAAPRGLGATACWVNRGQRWEINEQCASGSGWVEPLIRRVLLKAVTMYLWKRSPRSLTDTSPPSAWGSWVQTSPLSSAHRLNPQGQQPGLKWPLPSIALPLLSETQAPHLLCLAT